MLVGVVTERLNMKYILIIAIFALVALGATGAPAVLDEKTKSKVQRIK